MFSRPMTAVAAVLLAAVGFTNAQSNANCQSAGLDIGNGGTYYYNLASLAPFSFNSIFTECFGTTTPILQFPNGAQYTCSSINVAMGEGESVCPVQHSQMLAGGQYTIFFPEIGFARGFNVVNTRTTVTVTGTLTATGTVTPTTTIEVLTTMTISDTITLPTSTVTDPAATKGTLTLSPMTTITTTLSTTRTAKTDTTITVTSTRNKLPTPSCTSVVAAAAKMDSAATPTKIPRIRRDLLPAPQQFDARALAKREGPDGQPTTSITTLVPTAIIITATPGATTTTTSTVDITMTVTVTPVPFTTVSGTVEKTVTLPTKTLTSTVRTITTTTVTKTKTHLLKATITAQPTKC